MGRIWKPTTNVCFEWEMYGNRRASNELSPTALWYPLFLIPTHPLTPALKQLACEEICLFSFMHWVRSFVEESVPGEESCWASWVGESKGNENGCVLHRPAKRWTVFFQQRNICLRERILKQAVTVTVRLWLSLSLMEFLRLFTLDSRKLGKRSRLRRIAMSLAVRIKMFHFQSHSAQRWAWANLPVKVALQLSASTLVSSSKTASPSKRSRKSFKSFLKKRSTLCWHSTDALHKDFSSQKLLLEDATGVSDFVVERSPLARLQHSIGRRLLRSLCALQRLGS